MTKRDYKDFGTSTNRLICDKIYVDDDAKISDYWHIT